MEALRAGIHPRTLYALRDSGEIERVARGLFRLSTLPPPSEPDLMTVAKKVPHAVFCLVTAMAFHRLTTQVPHAVEIALARTSANTAPGASADPGVPIFPRLSPGRHRHACR